MKIIAPNTIETADITTNASVSVDATTYGPDWQGEWDDSYAGGYDTDDVVYKDTTLYRSLGGSNADDPETTNDEVDPDTPSWQVLGETNPYRMFDGLVGGVTERSGSIQVTIEFAQSVDTIAMFGLGAVEVTIEVEDGTGVVSETHTKDLREDPLLDWEEYFFKPLVEPRSDYTYQFENLYLTGTVTVTITAASGGTAECGLLLLGRGEYIGDAYYGIGTGIMDFSTKERDDFGRTYLSQGNWAKEMSCTLYIANEIYDRVARTLTAYRGTECVWDANAGDTDYSSFVVYGFFIDWSQRMVGPTHAEVVLEIEGLT